jgi:S-adenosylmethionine hydrolase
MRRIALLTDFGTRDPYVASMKGVIASRCDAHVDDLTHEIDAFEVAEGAWFLRVASKWWPEGTIFVCVIDPGVGTARRIIAAERDGHIFLAPDNGLLTFIDPPRVISVENESLFLETTSTTFHGRDRFAPLAAAAANGMPLHELGPVITDMIRLEYEKPSYGDGSARGTIVHVDHFGNAITDIERAEVRFDRFTMRAHYTTIAKVQTDYASPPEPFMIVGSSGTIEISVSGGSAADVLHLRRGDRVEITKA